MPACAPVSETAWTSDRMQRNGGQRDGRLFAGGQQHIHLPLAGQRHDFFGQLDQIVGHAAHGGDDDDDLVALRVIFGHARGDILDAFGVADRSAAVFLNDQSHEPFPKRESIEVLHPEHDRRRFHDLQLPDLFQGLAHRPEWSVVEHQDQRHTRAVVPFRLDDRGNADAAFAKNVAILASVPGMSTTLRRK